MRWAELDQLELLLKKIKEDDLILTKKEITDALAILIKWCIEQHYD